MKKIILFQYALYLVIIAIILLFAARAMWIILFFFAYRFWMVLIPYKYVNEHLHLLATWHYTILILMLTAGTYAMFYYVTQKIEMLKYVILILMIIIVLRYYSFSDIFFFKDYMVSHGMWSQKYWDNQIHQLFISSMSKKENIFQNVWNGTINFIKSLFKYAKI